MGYSNFGVTNENGCEQLPIPPDEFSYFCKFDQLADIPCNIGGTRYSLDDSAFIPVEDVFPEERG